MKGKRRTDTFWGKVIFDNNLTIKEVATGIGVKNPCTLGIYIIGQAMPSDDKVQKLCDMFNIDFDKGKNEFIKQRKKYQAERNQYTEGRSVEYDTVWGHMRADKMYSMQFISQKVGVNCTSLYNYFKGDGIPPLDLIEKLCELFEVDFVEGKNAFIHDFEKKHPGKVWVTRDKALPKPPPNTKARSYKDNFWSKERVKRNWSASYIAKELGGICPSAVYNWFTGRNIPNDENIEKICKLFGIDFDKGKKEFIKAHQEWYSWKYDKRKLCKHNTLGVLNKENEDVALGEKVREMLFGKTSYKVYRDVEALLDKHQYKEVLELLYPLIDIDIFCELVKVLL